ncbi:regulator of G-protein signaling protein-like [Ahaetulla prasina]|uniref:regulator of G-protein signaling protein-like n=1 Tax=Ahaetulla prasina TaxID=499056 RepID=UPI0026490EF3|nr:regulator of G-protein signaling protein-like [Ahaetulla prasina]
MRFFSYRASSSPLTPPWDLYRELLSQNDGLRLVELIGSKHLSVLLKDEIFTDFFNTFLNLPVFGQTPLFICRTRQWYLWPELPCNQVSKHKGLLNWMEKHRLPFFCKTNLFLHYVLCAELVSFIRSPEAAEMLRWRKADQWLLEKCIAGSRGMWRFRSFMQGMAGEELTKFWLAAERILGIDETDESQQDLYVSLFQILMATHLQEGSTVVTLCNTTVESLLKKTPFHRQHVHTRREILNEMQKVALFKIESYWLPNFFIHCKLSMEEEPTCLHLLNQYQDRSLQIGMQRQKGIALPPMSIRESSLDTKSYYSLKNKRELWDQIRGRSLSHKAKKKDGRSQKPKSYKGSPVPKKLTFSRKSLSSPSPCHKERIWDSEDVMSFDESPNFKSSPSEFFTSPVSDEFPDKCTYNKLRSSTPVVQFPSMLALKTFIKSPPCLDFLPWVLTADKCAGRPFREFLLRRNYAVEVHLLDLWHDLEDFLRMMLCSLGEGNILLRHVMGERICELYLTQSNNWHLPLKLTTLQSLQNLLPSGHVIPWVLKAQKEVCKILSFLYEEFLQNDDKMFLYYVSGKEKKPNAEEPYDRTENLRLIRRIIESLHLSQALAGMRDIDLLTQDHWRLLGIQDLSTGGSIFMELEPVAPQMDYGSMTFEELARLNPKMAVELLSKNFREFCKRCPSGKVFVRPVVPKRSLQWARSSFSFLRKAVVRKPISKPRTLSEVMQNSLHFEYFRNFLRLHNAEAPLLFCLTVEDIKKELDPRIQQMQINECVRTYFLSPIPPEKLLHCDEYVIREIPKLPSVTLPILVTAQILVLRNLEEKWFNMYQGLYPDSDIALAPTGWKSKKDSALTSKQKRCWCMLTAFIRRICKFRKAMSYVGQRKRFENFLLKEVKNDKENIQSPTQTKPAIQSGVSGRSGPSSGPSEEPELQQVKRKLPGGRIISVNFLVNDLYFYLEMERFLHLSDTVVMLASLGFYTERDIAFLKNKVTTITKLFLNSDIPPKLRVNLTDAQCIQIRTLISEGVLNRTLYHGAIIAIFPHLLYFWKKYCYWKVMKCFRKRKGEKTDESPPVPLLSPTKAARRSSGFSGEDHPIIRFTLLKGIQLLLPQPREATDELPGEKCKSFYIMLLIILTIIVVN